MDPSLALAIDGLRAVQRACSEVILANAGEEGERTAIVACADVEQACLDVLGETTKVPSGNVTSESSGSRLGGALNIFKNSPLTALFGGSADATSSAAEPAETAGGGGAEGALKRAITNAHLQPITDIVILHGDDPVPPGYTKLTHSVTGTYPADLNGVSSKQYQQQ